ncbi:GPI transamidase component PIG-T [Schistocerca gregaria]|uniref:GPI transamidase component PIG-T n=1 Tax=Schistocerca gregaria TaxID=7010 RepID=UPI00211DDE3E|nr:GPI transamidase component PIG-T [Schistocerca gregaria]
MGESGYGTKLISTLILCLTVVLASSKNDVFNEELLLKPLPDDHVYAYFQFTTVWDVEPDAESFKHSHLFPRPLGEIVAQFDVQELHVSLTGGLWRHQLWGYPVRDAAPGAEVWAWFKPTNKDIDKLWKELTGALSGLLCASLNFIDKSNSLQPEYSLRPSGVTLDKQLNSSLLRYAALPREIVCTENLTPWKKLLPCESKRGLATLLNAGFIHNTNYHSLGVHLRPICRDETCNKISLELQQTVSLVYDIAILSFGSSNWSIRKLFGLGLGGACPLANSSMIYVDLSKNETGVTFQLIPPPETRLSSWRGGYETKYAVYDVRKITLPGSMISIAAETSSPKIFTVNIPPVLHANRYIVGYGQERGGIVTRIHNTHWKEIDVVYMENIPWFIPVYLHTLKITSQGRKIEPVLKKYVPGMERARSYYLEILIRLPQRSVTEISIEFEYVFLKWQEYPPDANHGFYVGAAIITAMLPLARSYTALPQDVSLISASFNASREGYLVELRTETLIVTLPTPDFSMPYNVICLACTVVALAFGPLHNITTRRLQVKEKGKGNKLINWIKSQLRRKSDSEGQPQQTQPEPVR